MLRATAAWAFSTSQRPKVVRDRQSLTLLVIHRTFGAGVLVSKKGLKFEYVVNPCWYSTKTSLYWDFAWGKTGITRTLTGSSGGCEKNVTSDLASDLPSAASFDPWPK